MFTCRAAWQRCGPLARRAAARLPRDAVQRRQMSSVPGGSGENVVYAVLCSGVFVGGITYAYNTVAGDKARYNDRVDMIQSRPTIEWEPRPWPPKSEGEEEEEEAVAEEEEEASVAEAATEAEAPAEEAEVVVVAEAVAEAAEVVVEDAEVVVEAAEVVVEAAEVVVEAAQEVETVAEEVAQVAEAVEEAAQALAEPAAVEEPAAENNGTPAAPLVEEADSS